ncbi:MAG: hypothetical protein PHP52_13730 [Bacteroidales bacterium]|nr:hypothetical protein [Bacteroidales bacterium]
MKSLFYTNKQTWWLIGFSMIISGGILTIPQVITSFIINKDFSGLWIIWSAVIGTAFGKVFFAHLWHNVPIKTENELILFRYSGVGAKMLHVFRSLYVGVIIAPIGLSMAFLAFGRIAGSLFDISTNYAILIILFFVIISTFFNGLKQRLKLDFIYLFIFILCLIGILFFLYLNIGSLSELSQTVALQNNKVILFPQKGSIAFNSFLIFVLLQWWSASIIDFPDINGQKLMAAKDVNTISKSIVLPSLLLSIFLILIYTIPFYILLIKNQASIVNSGEIAFLSILQNAIPTNMYFIVLIFFLLPFVSAVNNTQNWSASLIIQNFYVYYINKKASIKDLNNKGLIVMVSIAIISAVMAMFSDSILDLIKLLLVITAGVGPVFIFRWYWHRINALSQLSAMVLSLIYPNIYEQLYANNSVFKSIIELIMLVLRLEYFPLKILILTITVTISWLFVTFITKPTEESTLKSFAETVTPGGFWKNYKKGKSLFPQRLFVAIILTISGFIFYLTYWQFVIGQYIFAVFLFLLFVILTYTGYLLLKKLNKLNAKN